MEAGTKQLSMPFDWRGAELGPLATVKGWPQGNWIHEGAQGERITERLPEMAPISSPEIFRRLGTAAFIPGIA